MKLSLSCKFAVLAAVLVLASHAPTTSSASAVLVVHGSVQPSNTGLNSETLALKKRADDDHDHDHDHPTSAAPITSPTPTAPAHDHDHDHDLDENLDQDHAEGHSHGPARTCETHSHDHGEYIVWHHIVALIVLTVIAGLGCALPMMIHDNPRTRFAVQVGKYFGAGVVLSVAFVHIMPEALFALTHPCLSTAWTEDYPGYAPLIMMVSGLTMLVIEFLASSLVFNVEAENRATAAAAAAGGDLESHDHWNSHSQKVKETKHSVDSDSDSASPKTAAAVGPAGQGIDDCNHAHGLTLLQCGPGVSTKVSTYMLEIGIALHSVFIGIALGVLAGSEFLAMTIAICFHQFFEGIALGSRIADLSFRKKYVPVLLVLAFALVTPLGVAIGMGVRSTYRAGSVENLITMGVFNSIACGVLLYTAYVTLLGGDILYSERFRAETKASKASYLVAVWLGALSMAVIALWA
ncbi:ZIP zinc transporter-domain-containing protein [Gamsiella multidivaricata]|uniref:ZIP zinc transporter-domain-containing protein n=1 Tax=Gamsiella multidivaricata TaxID=101098 RepID=UPI00221FE519|nr:ZIP zinc transporter-domain-containing protein [Gamsiella multidivaricata]KAG0362730.1 high-affinity Zn(2+) transporter zrt1 [Gamsiella multidivaricata]KAI7816585.1 ZIP zinc transporter-domain-containing protein [Gamsiella multidivaricata]